MSNNTRARVARLENATVTRRSGALLVATDQAEAERLHAQHPSALIIITGVPRASRRFRPAKTTSLEVFEGMLAPDLG